MIYSILKGIAVTSILVVLSVALTYHIYNADNDRRIRLYNELSESVVIVQTDLGLGSGVAIEDGTYVITAKHVIDDATKLVVISNNNTMPAKILYKDDSRDIAILQLQGFKIKPIKKIRTSGTLYIGERVYGIGNPGRLEDSFYDGIISGLKRMVIKDYIDVVTILGNFKIPEYYYGVIQLDIGASPGFSGGGVFDKDGTLIGILTMGHQVGDISLVQPVDILAYLNVKEL